MSDQYTHNVLKAVAARVCQPLGWHAIQSNACDILSEMLGSYIGSIGRSAAAYSFHGGEHLCCTQLLNFVLGGHRAVLCILVQLKTNSFT